MFRSNVNTEKSDFNKIKDADHIDKVWEKIEKSIPVYLTKMIEKGNEFAVLKDNPPFKIKTSSPDKRNRLSEIF